MLDRLCEIDKQLSIANIKVINGRTREERDNLSLLNKDIIALFNESNYSIKLEDKDFIEYLNKNGNKSLLDIIDNFAYCIDSYKDILLFTIEELNLIKSYDQSDINFIFNSKRNNNIKNFDVFINNVRESRTDGNMCSKYFNFNISSNYNDVLSLDNNVLDKIYEYFDTSIRLTFKEFKALYYFIKENSSFDFSSLAQGARYIVYKMAKVLTTSSLKVIEYYNEKIDIENAIYYMYKTEAERKMFKLLRNHSSEILETAFKNKYRKFINLMYDYLSSWKSYRNVDMQCKRCMLCENVNLNSLTIDDLNEISSCKNTSNMDIVLSKKVDYSEYKIIMKLDSTIIRIFEKITGKYAYRVSVAQTMNNTLKDNINKKKYKKYLDNNIESIAKAISSKNILSICQSHESLNIIDVLIIESSMLKEYKDEIRKSSDVIIALNNMDFISNYKDFESFKRESMFKDNDISDFIKNFNTSIYENEEAIGDMYSSGLIKICNDMYGDRCHNKNNLSLIVKAHVKGKLKDIKFIDDDFDKEISIHVSDDARYEWKDNLIKKNKFTVREAYDIDTILNIGAVPVKTCQHYSDGSYRECLLSNFDTNKKAIIVEKNGKVVGRALIRLTKMKLKSKDNKLSFVDIDNTKDIEDNTKINDGEYLTLFLEKAYISDNDIASVQEEIINLCIEKAKLLGAKLVTSTHYSCSKYKFEEKGLYIYLSKSKNSSQYLDSCGGFVSSEKTGKYIKCRSHIFD